ncbi:MAG TPA: glycosyltransferase family 2 protein [Nitrospirota bacterium]|nr:glycosyltransferase family 2 protein [Nitrospirota bacterium]
MQVSVITINNSNPELILGCLESVYTTAGGLDVEAVVVDNATTDGSIEAVRARFPQARIIVNDKKEGFSANNNKGLRAAKGEFLMLLNDDTVVHEGALEMMAGFLEAHPEAGAAGAMLINPDGTPQFTGRGTPGIGAAVMISLGLHRLFPDNPVTSKYYMKKGSYSEAEEVESVNGAAMMVRREALDKAGYLDEGFFLFCEDVDWSIRIREAGYKLFFLPGARITHFRGSSTGGRRAVKIYHKSLMRFYRKHYAKKHVFLVNWLVYLGIFIRFLIYYAYGGVRRKTPGRPE